MYGNMRLIWLLCQEEVELGLSEWDLALHLEREEVMHGVEFAGLCPCLLR